MDLSCKEHPWGFVSANNKVERIHFRAYGFSQAHVVSRTMYNSQIGRSLHRKFFDMRSCQLTAINTVDSL